MPNIGSHVIGDGLESAPQASSTYTPSGPEIVVNTTYARSQAQSDVNLLANGNFIVTWIDADFNSTAGRFIRAQIYSSDGLPLGGELTLAAASAIQPAIAGLADGGFVVAWIGSGGVRTQMFDAAGVAASPILTVSPMGAYSFGIPDIVGLADGGFAISWHDNRDSGSDITGSGVHLRTYDSSGAAVGGDVLVNTNVSGNQADTSLTALADGGYVVTWTDRGAGWVIKAQLFDAAGARVGSEFVVNAASGGTSVESAVTALANGNFAVAWYESGAHHVQVFAPTGTPVGAPISTPSNLSGTQVGPAIAALSDGGVAIAWTANVDPASDGSGSGIFVQAYGSDGLASGALMRVNSQTNGDQVQPSIVGLDHGGFVVTWTDLNAAGADDDQVMAQVFGREAAFAINSNGGGDSAAVDVAEGTVQATTVTSQDGDGPVVYWIEGGADAGLFTIDAETGELSFVDLTDFEAPADADGDNVYDVIVGASDGQAFDSQAIAFSVGNVDEAVTITSYSGDQSVELSHSENGWAVGRIEASDPEGDAISYSISGGDDAALFSVDSVTGQLSFIAAPDFETPGDADGNNIYRVTVTAGTLGSSAEQSFSVSIVNANEGLAIVSNGGGNNASILVNEGNRNVTTVSTVDTDGDPSGYSIVGGADASQFVINPQTGQLQFAATPDWEMTRDADGNNVYEVVVAASDGEYADQQALTVTVRNLEDGNDVNGTTAHDHISMSASNYRLRTSNSEDEVRAREGNDIIYGHAGDDRIYGDAGNDVLIGGAGQDRLSGGSGSDQFVYSMTSESRGSERDTITDFSRSQGDRISLSGIDADSSVTGNQAFTFIGPQAFTAVAGQLRFQSMGSQTLVMADVDGDAVSDFEILVSSSMAPISTDFIL